ncbi:MAG: septum formation initiator family protein [Chitinophagaceae bacterium]|jgi:cell division protein FtsB|nr:MAG: septum formation initiator family protein [Chitinophagaceae bacterium]
MVRRIPSLLKNKYVIATLAFLVWITFFDRNDLITQAGYVHQLHTLRDQKIFLQGRIQRTDSDLYELKSDPAMLEKFAREKYFMKKSNEDVYLIDGKMTSEGKISK